MSDTLTSPEARILVLEMTVAALVAHLPQSSRDEVVSMLAYTAGIPAGPGTFDEDGADDCLVHVRYWANEMLSRAMVSRKQSRPDSVSPEEAARLRFQNRPSAL